MITLDDSRYKCLSILYEFNLIFLNERFSCVAQAFQYSKTLDTNERSFILSATDGVEAIGIGQKISMRDGWGSIKIAIMRHLLKIQFSEPEAFSVLQATQDAYITYANETHDNFWGECICNECIRVHSKNNLGSIIMQLRSSI